MLFTHVFDEFHECPCVKQEATQFDKDSIRKKWFDFFLFNQANKITRNKNAKLAGNDCRLLASGGTLWSTKKTKSIISLFPIHRKLSN